MTAALVPRRSTISEVARRTGFTASALRYYEQVGLLQPARTPAGYRTYDDRDVERLRFVARAKGFGLTLDEVVELLALLDDDRCAPVQERLQALVDAKIDDAQHRIAELVAFTAELQRVATGLRGHTPDGPCDADCGCGADGREREPADGRSADVGTAAVRLTTKPSGAAPSPDVAIACTLPAGEVPDRLADWQRALAPAIGRERVDGGVRVRFAPGTDPGPLATLAAAEQGCCAFFAFVIGVDRSGVVLDVTAPPDAAPLVAALVGVAP